MTVEGIVKKGKVVLSHPAAFADGTRVSVRAVRLKERGQRNERRALKPHRLSGAAALMANLAGAIDDPALPRDLARNHDHYLYGTPKKK